MAATLRKMGHVSTSACAGRQTLTILCALTLIILCVHKPDTVFCDFR